MGRLFKILAAVVVALAASGAGLAAWALTAYNRPGPSSTTITVVIERGTGIDEIARLLQRAGVLAEPLAFRLAARWAPGRPLKAGEYEFAAAITPKRAIELMRSGRTVVRRLTVAEGLTVPEVMAVLNAAEGLSGTLPPLPPEGSLLPETYHYSYGDKREQVVRRMQEAMRALLQNLWRNRDPAVPLATPGQAVILASIVEKETAKAAERPRIAAVFLNRLKRNMRLQSDPTVAYGLTEGAGPLGRPLTRADLKRPSPYNTYLIDGLPPTPIANPGSASLEAVMRPAVTDDLYFVADGSGGHVFAATLEEHNRNVAKWRRFNKDAGDSRP
jgi:UPF0755 protein